MTATRILAGALATVALSGAAQGQCPVGPSAILESRSEPFHGFVYTQRMVISRPNGGIGLNGRWIATSYETEIRYPSAAPPVPTAIASHAPNFGACEGFVLSPHTHRSLCANARVAFDLREGEMYEAMSNRRVGRVSGSGSGSTMSIDIMGGPSPQRPPMTGPIQEGAQTQFDISLVSRGRHPTVDAAVITMRIAPANQPAGFTGEVTVSVTSSDPRRQPQIDVTRENGASVARITLLGNARERAAVAGTTTLTAGAVAADCTYERDWGLDELLLTLNAAP